MSLAGCQINPINVKLYLQKSLKIVDKTSADKIWSKKYKEIKVSPLMPTRVKKQQKQHPRPQSLSCSVRGQQTKNDQIVLIVQILTPWE